MLDVLHAALVILNSLSTDIQPCKSQTGFKRYRHTLLTPVFLRLTSASVAFYDCYYYYYYYLFIIIIVIINPFAASFNRVHTCTCTSFHIG